MNSGLFYGSTKHSRLLPKKHSFSYKTFYLWLDLFSIELFESNNLLFSYNSFNLFSIWDQDYLYKSDDKLIDKVFNCVEKKQLNFFKLQTQRKELLLPPMIKSFNLIIVQNIYILIPMINPKKIRLCFLNKL